MKTMTIEAALARNTSTSAGKTRHSTALDPALVRELAVLALRWAGHGAPAIFEAARGRAWLPISGPRLIAAAIRRAGKALDGETKAILSNLLLHPAVSRSIVELLREARSAGAIDKETYLAKFVDLTYPRVAHLIARNQYEHVNLRDTRIYTAQVQARTRKRAAPHDPAAVPADNVSYFLSGGRKFEPRTRTNAAPLLKSVHIDDTGCGHAAVISFDVGQLPQNLSAIYVEADVSARFDSPNRILVPSLLPVVTPGVFIENRSNYQFSLTITRDRNHPAWGEPMRLPVPLELLVLPASRSGIGRDSLIHLAAAIGRIARSDDDIVRLAFDYVRIMIWFGNSRTTILPEETLRRGAAGCGHLNALGGLLLELNGIPARGIGGTTPSFRKHYPGSGHSAIEYFDRGAGAWRYFDPYFDLLPGVAAAEFAGSEAGGIPVNFFAGRQAEVHKDTRTLAELFTYRYYFDPLQQFTLRNFIEPGVEERYGLDWLEQRPAGFAAVSSEPARPERLYVRCRALAGEGISSAYFASPEKRLAEVALTAQRRPFEELAELTPWEMAEIEIPRAIYP